MRGEEDVMDAYVEARSYERDARKAEKESNDEVALGLWQRYADLKERKGSYFLCMYGYFNVARICDKLSNWREAAESFKKAAALAERLGELSLWVFLMHLACQMHEKAGDYTACRDHYETIGNFFFTRDNFFGAADAYEHAAEIMSLAGEDISRYEVPVDAWQKNYEYWKEQGELDDAAWSLKRVDAYRSAQHSV